MFLRMTKNTGSMGNPFSIVGLVGPIGDPTWEGWEGLKARTHKPTFAESVLESADYSPELADSTTEFMPVS